MICTICGEDKAPYEFTGDYSDKYFFVHIRRYPNNKPRHDVCWDCGGGYRCLGCGNVKPASEFRVQGRYCHTCKSKWRSASRSPVFATFTSIKRRAAHETGDSGQEVAE